MKYCGAKNTTQRPWGSFETILVDDTLGKPEKYQIKRITVKPRQKLSLQFHNHRSEHWIIVQGEIVAQIGDDFFTLTRNQSLYIPKNVKHRIENDSKKDAVLIEVQIGDYLGEDDITRLEDIYDRI